MPKSDTQFNYFSVNERSIGAGFYLTGAGIEHIGTHEPYPIPTHPEMYNFSWNTGRILPEYQFVFIFQGEGEFESQATGPMRLKAGTGLFLLPDVWHRYRPIASIGWADYWISFNGIIPHLWQKSATLNPMRAIGKVAQAKAIFNTLARIHRMAMETPESPAAASLLALGMLAGLLAGHSITPEPGVAEGEHPHAGKGDTLLRKALEITWNHSHRNLSAELIARQLGVSRRTLERHFKTVHHRSILEEITACRISRSRLMLVNTHLPIKRIAHAAGFSSPTHQATTFRRELKTTPGQIRKGAALSGPD